MKSSAVGNKSLRKQAAHRGSTTQTPKVAATLVQNTSVPALSYQAWVNRLYKLSRKAKHMTREAPARGQAPAADLPPVTYHTTSASGNMPLEWLLHLHRTSQLARSATGSLSELDASTLVPVTFKLQYRCKFGQNLYIVGICSELGCWDVAKAVPLQWNDGDVWSTNVTLEAGRSVEYKYLVKNSDGSVARWQEASNAVLDLCHLASVSRKQRQELTLVETWCKTQRTFQWHTQQAGQDSTMGLVASSSYTVKQLQPGEPVPEGVEASEAEEAASGKGSRSVVEVVAAAAAYHMQDQPEAAAEQQEQHAHLMSAVEASSEVGEVVTRRKGSSVGGFARALVSVRRTVKLLRNKSRDAVNGGHADQLEASHFASSQQEALDQGTVSGFVHPEVESVEQSSGSSSSMNQMQKDAVAYAATQAAALRQQCLDSVVLELQRSLQMAQTFADPCHPDLLMADRRLAAASRQLAAVGPVVLPMAQ